MPRRHLVVLLSECHPPRLLPEMLHRPLAAQPLRAGSHLARLTDFLIRGQFSTPICLVAVAKIAFLGVETLAELMTYSRFAAESNIRLMASGRVCR